MAKVRSTRRNAFGFRVSRSTGPSSAGTKAAFEAGEKAFKASGGATPELKRVVGMYLATLTPPKS